MDGTGRRDPRARAARVEEAIGPRVRRAALESEESVVGDLGVVNMGGRGEGLCQKKEPVLVS